MDKETLRQIGEDFLQGCFILGDAIVSGLSRSYQELRHLKIYLSRGKAKLTENPEDFRPHYEEVYPPFILQQTHMPHQHSHKHPDYN